MRPATYTFMIETYLDLRMPAAAVTNGGDTTAKYGGRFPRVDGLVDVAAVP